MRRIAIVSVQKATKMFMKTLRNLSIRIFKMCCYSALPKVNRSLNRQKKKIISKNKTNANKKFCINDTLIKLMVTF